MVATIENIVNHIKSVKNQSHNKQGICLLLGAGADISSGGILFRELKIQFMKENGYEITQDIADNKLDREFEKIVNSLSQNGRCETLDNIMRKKSMPSEGYELLVMLAEMGYIDAVITTNFDYLLEETQNLLNIKPFTIFTPGKSIPQKYYLRNSKISPIYLKMHGDLSDRLVTHLTSEELESQNYSAEFINLFKYIIKKNSVLIIGYGGYDSLITDLFKQEMGELSDVYWCNISEPDEKSDLVSALKASNKLKYVNISFDKLFQELAMTFLKDVTLRNANPIFLPTVVKSKIQNQKELYVNKIRFPDTIISRKNETEQLEKFLQTYDEKCAVITGKYKIGKTCFIYKIMESFQDITFFPIIFDMKHGILENIALALGYETKVSFSLMYSFLNWWDQKKEHLVFIIDNLFNEECYNKFTENYYIEFFNFINISREFKYIQFVLCFQDNVYTKIKTSNIFASCRINKYTKINMKNFSNKEVQLLLRKYDKNYTVNSLEYNPLLNIPYVWEIIKSNNIDLSNDRNFFELYIDALYQNLQNSDSNITKHALNSTLMDIAYAQLFLKDIKLDNNKLEVYDFLKKQEIINEKNKIKYPEFLIYLCSKQFLKTNSWEETIIDNIIPIIQNSIKLSDLQIQAISTVFSMCKKIDDIGFVLNQLNMIVKNEITQLQTKVIINILCCCYKNNKDLFVGYINQIDIDIYTSNLQKYLLKLFVEFCPPLLVKLNNENIKLAYSAFIFKNDLLYQQLKKSSLKVCNSIYSSTNAIIVVLHLLTILGMG